MTEWPQTLTRGEKVPQTGGRPLTHTGFLNIYMYTSSTTIFPDRSIPNIASCVIRRSRVSCIPRERYMPVTFLEAAKVYKV